MSERERENAFHFMFIGRQLRPIQGRIRNRIENYPWYLYHRIRWIHKSAIFKYVCVSIVTTAIALHLVPSHVPGHVYTPYSKIYLISQFGHLPDKICHYKIKRHTFGVCKSNRKNNNSNQLSLFDRNWHRKRELFLYIKNGSKTMPATKVT